jgi:hypothetical protein
MQSLFYTPRAPKQPIKTTMQASFPPVLPLRTPAQVARQAAYDAHVFDADVERVARGRCRKPRNTIEFFRKREEVLSERGIRSSKKLHPGVLQRLEQQQQGPPLGPILAQMPWPQDLEPDRAVMTVIAAVARMYGVFYIICTPQQARGFVRDAHEVAATAGGEGSARLTAWLPPAEVVEEQEQEDAEEGSDDDYSGSMRRRRSSQQQAEDRAARMEKRRRLSEQQQDNGKGRDRRQQQLRPACVVVFHGTLASAALAFFQRLLVHAADRIADLDQFSRGMRAESLKWHVPQLGQLQPPPLQVLTVPIVHSRSIATHMLQSEEDRLHASMGARFGSHVTQQAAAAIRRGQSLAQQMDLKEYGEGDCWDQVEEQQRQQDASYQAGQQAVRSVGQAQWAWLQQQGEEEQDEEEEEGVVQLDDEDAGLEELLQLQQQAQQHAAAVAALMQQPACGASPAGEAAGGLVDLTADQDDDIAL